MEKRISKSIISADSSKDNNSKKKKAPLNEYIYGINSVISLLNINAGNRKIYKVYILENKSNSKRIIEINSLCEIKSIPVEIVSKKYFYNLLELEYRPEYRLGYSFDDKILFAKLNLEKEFISSQGVIAEVSNYNYSNLEIDIGKLTSKKDSNKDSIFVILDGVTDVGNFGSILRNCAAFSVSGVIITKDRSVNVNRRISKISSGALEEVKIYRVINLAKTIQYLKTKGFWIYGTTLENDKNINFIDSINYSFPAAVIFGSEYKGISQIVKKNCDFLIKIDLASSIQSLNVAVASGIVLYSMSIQKKNFLTNVK